MEHLQIEPMELLEMYNELHPDNIIDKSQVYRWIKGQLPRDDTMYRLAAILLKTDEPDPETLMRHPDDDWFSRVTSTLSRKEKEQLKETIDMLIIRRTGTDG